MSFLLLAVVVYGSGIIAGGYILYWIMRDDV